MPLGRANVAYPGDTRCGGSPPEQNCESNPMAVPALEQKSSSDKTTQ